MANTDDPNTGLNPSEGGSNTGGGIDPVPAPGGGDSPTYTGGGGGTTYGGGDSFTPTGETGSGPLTIDPKYNPYPTGKGDPVKTGKPRAVKNPAPPSIVLPPVTPWKKKKDDDPPPSIRPTPYTPPPTRSYERVLTYNALNGFEPIIYGEVHNVGAGIAYWSFLSGGALMVRYVIGRGPLEEISNIRIDNKPISSIPGMALYATNAAFNYGYHVCLGTPTQDVSGAMSFWRPGWVPSRYPGVAYVLAIFQPPTEASPDLDVTNFLCDVKGLKIRDPRLDATLVNKYFSENPALIIADLLTNKRYGGRMADSKINWDLLQNDTAPFCDEDIGGGVKRYPIGLVIQQQRKLEDHIENIRAHAQLFLRYNGGKIQILADRPRTYSGIEITDEDLILGGSKIIGKGRAEVPNKVDVQFTDSDNSWKEDTAELPVPGIENAYVEIITDTYSLLGTRKRHQAERIGTYLLNRGLRDKYYRVSSLEIGTKVLPGDRIKLTDSELNLSSQDMVVSDVEPVDGTWQILLEIYDENIYSNSISTNVVIPTPLNSLVPEPPSKYEFLGGTAPPPVRHREIATLTHNNASFFDADKLQDRDRLTHALQFNNDNSAGATWLRAHFASALSIREIVLWFDPAYIDDSENIPSLDVQFSTNNGASWTTVGFSQWENFQTRFITSKGRNQITGIFDSSLGAVTDLRITLGAQTAKSCFINDIEFFSYTGDNYNTAAGFRIRTNYGFTENGVGEGGLIEYDIAYYPDSTRPIPLGDIWTETIIGPPDEYGGISSLRVNNWQFIEIAAISQDGFVSDFRPLRINQTVFLSDIAGPTDGLAQNWIPQNEATSILLAANQVDLPISFFDGIIPLTSSAGTANLHGIANGYLGRQIRLKNAGSFNWNIPNESATEATTYNRIINRGGGTLIVRPGDILELNYVTTPAGPRWDSNTSTLPWGFITGAPATYASDWATLGSKPAWVNAHSDGTGTYGNLVQNSRGGYIGLKMAGSHNQFMIDAVGNGGIHDETLGVWHWYLSPTLSYGGLRIQQTRNGWFGIELGTSGTNNLALMWSGAGSFGTGQWGLLQGGTTWLWYVVSGELTIGLVPPQRVNDVLNRTNWATVGPINVAREIAWRNFGSSHTIVDNSDGGYGGGNSDPINAWGPTYPMLVGYNGSTTYGVKVDRSRYAEQLVSGATGVTPATASNDTTIPTTAFVKTVAGNAPIVQSGAWNLSGGILSGSIEGLNLATAGAAVGDPVAVGYSGISGVATDNWILTAYVEAANVVRVCLYNGTGATRFPNGTVTVRVFK